MTSQWATSLTSDLLTRLALHSARTSPLHKAARRPAELLFSTPWSQTVTIRIRFKDAYTSPIMWSVIYLLPVWIAELRLGHPKQALAGVKQMQVELRTRRWGAPERRHRTGSKAKPRVRSRGDGGHSHPVGPWRKAGVACELWCKRCQDGMRPAKKETAWSSGSDGATGAWDEMLIRRLLVWASLTRVGCRQGHF